MIWVYLNSPAQNFHTHHNPDCPRIRIHEVENQRVIHVNLQTISSVLQDFNNQQYFFAAEAGKNDMWLVIDFGNIDFEQAVALYIKKLVGEHYLRIENAEVKIHC